MKAMNRLETIYYKWLKRPHELKAVIDEGQGQPVILLHGIGKTGSVWKHVIEILRQVGHCRIIAYDLLGFGASPKPDWLDYNVDDHAEAVIKSLEKLKLKQQFILVGHSMGCLIAVRVARLRPDLIKHLVLYEMPLYEGLPEKRIYRLRLGFYTKFYNWVINYKPDFNDVSNRKAHNIANLVSGFNVDEVTWEPFIKSLENTIMKQTAADDIKHINIPMDVIYGRFDMFVIRGHIEKIFGKEKDNITSHSIGARHIITPKASQLIASRILSPVN
jgi:pimeloyl-ACP methyl ester carboxylesterase